MPVFFALLQKTGNGSLRGWSRVGAGAPSRRSGGLCPHCTDRPWADSSNWGCLRFAAPPKARHPEREAQKNGLESLLSRFKAYLTRWLPWMRFSAPDASEAAYSSSSGDSFRSITVVNAMRSPLNTKLGFIKYQPCLTCLAIICAASNSARPRQNVG